MKMKEPRPKVLTGFALLAATLGAAAAPAWATDYTSGPSFQILNQSGLSTTGPTPAAKFYYLGVGTIGNDFVVLKSDGTWSSAGSPGTGWSDTAWSVNTKQYSGAGVVPCHELSATSSMRIPPNIGGGALYVFQVNSNSPLFSKSCANSPSEGKAQTNGIFRTSNNGKTGVAPFSYFGKTLTTNRYVGASLTWLAGLPNMGAGYLPPWSVLELGSSATSATIDTTQVDLVGFPVNVTAKLSTSPGTTFPVPGEGIGFSFSPNGEVNMGAVKNSYSAFVNTLPRVVSTGNYQVNLRKSFANLMMPAGPGSSVVFFNPGKYIPNFKPSAFNNYFLNLINNYMWNPGAASGGLPGTLAWQGSLDTGGPYGALPRVTFNGTAITLPAAGTTDPNNPPYPNYKGKKPLFAIKFSAQVPGTSQTVVAYVMSPASYQVLCSAKVVAAGCGSPAAQVFAGNGALALPGDNNQFALLSPDEQKIWTDNYGGATNYNAVVGRLGFVISMAFNRGVAGGVTTPGGLCAGTSTLNQCWDTQSLWYPTQTGANAQKMFFMGDTSQNHFARWLHTAQISGIPMMTQPDNPTTLTSGVKMGMAYAFSNDENPTPAMPDQSQTPSKYDSNVSLTPPSGCNYITIMPWKGGAPNLSPVKFPENCASGTPLAN